MFTSILNNRRLILTLAIHELRQQYAGTFLGIVWAIARPMLTLLVFWFVFTYGFRMGDVTAEVPYFLVLFCALVPWFFFTDSVSAAVNAIVAKEYLVKKIAFPLEILPVIQILAVVIVHFILVAVLIFICIVYEVFPTILAVQVVYYAAATMAFVLGLSLLLCPINVFHRDTTHAVGVILGIWFWLTPIVWTPKMFPDQFVGFLKLNPMYFVVEGYRDALLYHRPFWEDLGDDMIFWSISALLIFAGSRLFARLKAHFADVL